MIAKREINHCEHVAYVNPDASALGMMEFDAMVDAVAGMNELLADVERVGGCSEEKRAEWPQTAFKNPRGGWPPLVSVGPSGIGGRFQNELF